MVPVPAALPFPPVVALAPLVAPGRFPNPGKPLDDPVETVTVTSLPTWIWLTWELSTSSSALYLPVLATTMSAVDDVFDPPFCAAAFDGLPSVEAEPPEPVFEPVALVPPAPLLPSCSPTVTFTEATVPSNVATSVAPASASCASVSASVAVWTRDASASIWALDAPDDCASDRVASALARSDSALLTADSRLAESMVARTWPALTLSPAATFTTVTVPDDVKLSSSVCASSVVPSAEIVEMSGPRVTRDELLRRRDRRRRAVVGAKEKPSDDREDEHGPDDSVPPKLSIPGNACSGVALRRGACREPWRNPGPLAWENPAS